MRSLCKGNRQALALYSYHASAAKKVAINLRYSAVFKAAQFLGKHAVKRIGDHYHDHIKVHLNQNRRKQGVQAEEFDGLGDCVFNSPAAGIIADYQFDGTVKIISNQEHRFLVAVAFDNHLVQQTIVILDRYHGLMHQRVGIFTLERIKVDLFPRLEVLELVQKFIATPAQGNKTDPLGVER